MTHGGDHTEDDIALVGEYALHLLGADDRLAFEKRLKDEPALRGLLRDWDENLVSMAEEIAPVSPPSRVKTEIETLLFGKPEKRAGLFAFFGLREAMLGFAFVAALVVFFVPQFFRGPDGQLYTAEIAAEDRALVVLASFDPETAQLAINRDTGGAASGRVLELWLIAEGASAPVSLGVMPDAQVSSITIPEPLVAPMFGGILAISDEPVGGSPTGAPTGAVLAVGPVVSS